MAQVTTVSAAVTVILVTIELLLALRWSLVSLWPVIVDWDDCSQPMHLIESHQWPSDSKMVVKRFFFRVLLENLSVLFTWCTVLVFLESIILSIFHFFSGHLFHIDFGYILGRDPKPMPPPMKLTKEMVDAMGGPGSEQYKTFTDLCFSAFFHLRRLVILTIQGILIILRKRIVL